MKVVIVTQGSRGDVQPFVALANMLGATGHEVKLVGPSTFSPLAKLYDVHYVPIYDITASGFADPAASKAIKAGRNGRLRYLLQQGRSSRRFMARALEEVVAAIEEDDIDIVVHNHMVPGYDLAEWLDVPNVPVGLPPFLVPTNTFPNPWFPLRVPQILNSASYVATRATLKFYLGNTNTWRRKTLGLSRRSGSGDFLRLPDGRRPTVLQAFSRHILPPSTEYPDWVHTTGYWFLPAATGWVPSQELSGFLQDGEPPVYIGLGSLSAVDDAPRQTVQMFAEAVRLAGVRAIIFAGQGPSLADDGGRQILYVNDQVPFDWLFPRTAAIVHHGGSGTTGAALASGRPQVVCPAIFEQPFNAQRMYANGVAPPPQSIHELTPRRLAEGIRRAVTDQSMSARAEELGHQIRAEGGLTTARTILESLI